MRWGSGQANRRQGWTDMQLWGYFRVCREIFEGPIFRILLLSECLKAWASATRKWWVTLKPEGAKVFLVKVPPSQVEISWPCNTSFKLAFLAVLVAHFPRPALEARVGEALQSNLSTLGTSLLDFRLCISYQPYADQPLLPEFRQQLGLSTVGDSVPTNIMVPKFLIYSSYRLQYRVPQACLKMVAVFL